MTNQTFKSNIAAHLTGSSTPTLEIQYIALSSTYDTPDFNSTLEGEFYRVAPTSVTTDNNNDVVIEHTISAGTGTAFSSDIASVTDASNVTVNDGSGFAAGDRVLFRKNTGSTNFTQILKIDSVSTNDLTFTTPIEVTPLATDSIQLMVSRVHVINGTASTTLNDGSPVAIIPYIREKTATDEIVLRFTIKL